MYKKIAIFASFILLFTACGGNSSQEKIGSECSTDEECGGATCRKENGSQKGLCSITGCTENKECGSLGFCQLESSGGYCVKQCHKRSDCEANSYCEYRHLGDTLQGGACTILNDNQVTADNNIVETNERCFNIEENKDSQITVDIPEGTTSYQLNYWSKKGTIILPLRFENKGGTASWSPQTYATKQRQETDYMTQTALIMQANAASIMVPQGPTMQKFMVPGPATFTFSLPSADQVCYRLLTKKHPGKSIDFNVYLVNIHEPKNPTVLLTAKSAANNAEIKQMFTRVKEIYHKAGISVGKIRYYDITNEVDHSLYTPLAPESPTAKPMKDLRKLVTYSKAPGRSLDERLSMNVFLVDEFNPSSSSTLGLSPSLPGTPGLHGMESSGIVFATKMLKEKIYRKVTGPEFEGYLLAHEVGHYLGLAHPSDAITVNSSQHAIYDPIPDTPECPLTTFLLAASCPDAKNLMFAYTDFPSYANLTTEQAKVMKANMLVK